MKAAARRRTRRTGISSAVRTPAEKTDELAVLRRVSEQLEAMQPADLRPELSQISGSVLRIEQRIDAIEKRAVLNGALSGAISGGLVATAIQLIKSRMGF